MRVRRCLRHELLDFILDQGRCSGGGGGGSRSDHFSVPTGCMAGTLPTTVAVVNCLVWSMTV